jgi:RNA polymerase sigma-70 factor (ECF subfamily)
VSNLSLNARRSRKSGTTVALDETQGADWLTTGEGGPATSRTFTPDSRMEHREMQAALEEALETLPEKQRLSLILFTIEGWAQKDIAELLECSLENVKWNVFQARKRLREQLGGKIDL